MKVVIETTRQCRVIKPHAVMLKRNALKILEHVKIMRSLLDIFKCWSQSYMRDRVE